MKIWRPYTQMQSAAPAIKLSSAQGAYLYTRDGRKIFDGISSWWLITHGHAHPAIAEAIAKQSEKLEQAVFANFTHEPAEQLTELLGCLLPKELDCMFFSDNGSTAVEVAMKMAYQYCAQSGSPQKNKFLAFSNSYHGDTCGAMSVSASSAFTQPYSGLTFEVLRAQQGQLSTDPLEKWVGPFRDLLQSKAPEICAVLIEPLLQGAGGMIVWPIEAVQEICRLAKQHNTLLIFDEVMTGFGRTGSLFAFEQVGVTPDFLCLSKGLTGGFLPMGLTITKDSIFAGFLHAKVEKMFFHGHSFTGNALSCAAAVANLQILSASQASSPATSITSKWQQIQQAQHAGLHKLKGQLQEQVPVCETRVCGTVGIIELEQQTHYGSQFSQEIITKALAKGLFLRPLGRTLYLMPPYCSTPQEIEWAWEMVGESLTAHLS